MTLRDRLIEAGADEVKQYFTPLTDYAEKQMVGEILDAFLAVLAEHADEWRAHAARQMNKNRDPDYRATGAEWLLAVLADPEEDTQ